MQQAVLICQRLSSTFTGVNYWFSKRLLY